MSERWSYCSEFIYCRKCAEVFKTAANEMQARYFGEARSEVSTIASGGIIVGFGGGLSPHDSRLSMQRLRDSLGGKMCHSVRWCALYDDGNTEIFATREP